MIRAERQGTKVVKIAPPSPKADRVRQMMASNPSANLEEIARLARCCTTTVKKVWAAESKKQLICDGSNDASLDLLGVF